jgi:hypothetical protein
VIALMQQSELWKVLLMDAASDAPDASDVL